MIRAPRKDVFEAVFKGTKVDGVYKPGPQEIC